MNVDQTIFQGNIVKDRSFKPLVVASALLVCTFIFILLLPPVTDLYLGEILGYLDLGRSNKYTNMDQVSLKLNVKSKSQSIT